MFPTFLTFDPPRSLGIILKSLISINYFSQANAIVEDERKAAAKYGNMKKKQTDVMRKRMMGVMI